MDTIKNFRKCNKISQVALAEYLQVTQGFISQVEKDVCPLPEWVISKILDNPYNWDTTMLVDNRKTDTLIETQQVSENSLLEYLQRKVAELEKKIDKLNNEKAELLQDNAVLKYEVMMLTPRKGDAEDAGNSLSADVV